MLRGTCSISTGVVYEDSTTDGYVSPNPTAGNLLLRVRKRTTIKRRMSATAVINVATEGTYEEWGLTWYDAIMTSWELTTMSFLVDWALHVGDWLGAMRPTSHKVLSVSTTWVSNEAWEYRLEGCTYRWSPYQGFPGTVVNNGDKPDHVRGRDVVTRVIHAPNPTAFPVFDVRALSFGQECILASLAALRVSSKIRL